MLRNLAPKAAQQLRALDLRTLEYRSYWFHRIADRCWRGGLVSPHSGHPSRDMLDTYSGGDQWICLASWWDAVVLGGAACGRWLRTMGCPRAGSKSWWRPSERAL